MPTATTKKKPAVRRPQGKQGHKPTPAQLEAERRKHLAFVKRMVGRHHHRWITAHPSAGLGDLRLYLEGVRDELLAFDYDDVLADIMHELGDAADYLSDFSPVDEPVDGDGEMANVLYRLDDVEEDIGDVDELIEALGEPYKVTRLPKWKPRTGAA